MPGLATGTILNLSSGVTDGSKSCPIIPILVPMNLVSSVKWRHFEVGWLILYNTWQWVPMFVEVATD